MRLGAFQEMVQEKLQERVRLRQCFVGACLALDDMVKTTGDLFHMIRRQKRIYNIQNIFII
jgi:hypothetical protein